MFRPAFRGAYAKARLSSSSVAANATNRPNLARSQQLLRQSRRQLTTSAAPAGSRIINFIYGTTLVLGLGIAYVYITDTRASAHRYVVIPALRYFIPDPEEAHEVGNKALERLHTFGLHPRERGDPDKVGDLEIEVFGQTLRNPIGTSAGIDKHADIPDPLFAIGPAIIEIGGTTPQPQSGNPKPRVFRVSSQNAMINRYGLNSEGADHIAQRLRQRVRHFAESCGFGHDAQGETLVLDGYAGVPAGSLTPGKLLAINIAKNKSTPESDIDAVTKDYVYCAERLAPYADILVVNVSSPNTPGLRSLQNQEALTKILSSVVKAARSVQRTTKPAVMVKVSPDEDSDEQVAGICQAVWEADVDGIVVGNTTNSRPAAIKKLGKLTTSEEQHLLESGGFSGPHLFEKTLSMVKKYKKLVGDGPVHETESKPESKSPTPETSAPKPAHKETNAIKEELKGNLAGSPSGDAVSDSIQTGAIPLKNIADEKDSEKKPLINLPSVRFFDQPQEDPNSIISNVVSAFKGESEEAQETTKPAQSKKPEQSQEDHPVQSEKKSSPDLARRDQPKVIFATGGITNGEQALQILNAGASVAMVYTALVYGGVGTISRIKDEMRKELAEGERKRATKTSTKAIQS